jgi:hypothetical protein
MPATAIQSDAIWLRAADYRVEALNSKLTQRVAELARGLKAGLPACPDTNRREFFDVELPNGWAYIHVCDKRKTVYLVAYSG